jgi:hypothetical protein
MEEALEQELLKIKRGISFNLDYWWDKEHLPTILIAYWIFNTVSILDQKKEGSTDTYYNFLVEKIVKESNYNSIEEWFKDSILNNEAYSFFNITHMEIFLNKKKSLQDSFLLHCRFPYFSGMNLDTSIAFKVFFNGNWKISDIKVLNIKEFLAGFLKALQESEDSWEINRNIYNNSLLKSWAIEKILDLNTGIIYGKKEEFKNYKDLKKFKEQKIQLYGEGR